MALLDDIRRFLTGGNQKPQQQPAKKVQPKINLAQLQQAAGRTIGNVVKDTESKVTKTLQQAPKIKIDTNRIQNNIASGLNNGINSVANTRLKGLDQLVGGKNTVGTVAQKTPVLGDALRFSAAQNQAVKSGQSRSQQLANFGKGIVTSGAEGAAYVAPELRIVRAAPGANLALKAGAKFVNNAAPAAALGGTVSALKGNDAKRVAQDAALAGVVNGGAALGISGLKLAARNAKDPAVQATMRTNAQRGFIAGPNARGYEDAAMNDRTFLSAVDNQPKFEVSDAKAKVSKGGVKRINNNGETTLGDLLDHKELYKQYPDAKNTRVVLDDTLPPARDGQYDAENNVISINPRFNQSAEQLRATLLHESQHQLDATEGLALGTTPQAVGQEAYARNAAEQRARDVVDRSRMSQRELDAQDGLEQRGPDPQAMLNRMNAERDQAARERLGVTTANQATGRIMASERSIPDMARTMTDDELIDLAESNPELVAQISRYREENNLTGMNTIPRNDRERQFAESVRNSPEVSDEASDALENTTYTPKSNRELEARANNRVADGSAAEYLDGATNTGVLRGIDSSRADEVVATTIALARKLDSDGDKLGAAKLYSDIAEKLTDLGRGVQAASLLARQTPEGQLLQAERAFNRAGIEPSDDIRLELADSVDRMRTLTNQRDQLQLQFENAGSTAERRQLRNELDAVETELARERHEMGLIVDAALPSNRTDQITSLWKAGLLSAPTTLGGAIVGNVAKTAANVVRDGLAAGFDQITSRLINGGTRSNIFSVKSQAARVAGGLEGVKRGADNLTTGFDERNVAAARDTAKQVFKGDNVASWAAKAYTDTIFGALGSVDQPFFYGELRKSLTEQAQLAAKNAGARGAARKQYVEEFLINPPEAAKAKAQLEANDATFTNPTILGNIAAGAKRAAGDNPLAKGIAELVLPFAKIPSAVATSVLKYSPAGGAAEIIKGVASARKGAGVDVRQLNRALADSSIGTGAIAIGAALYASNNFTLATPTTDAEKKLWEQEGKKPYSIKIGDKWVSLNYIQPFGSIMAMGAAYNQAQKDGKPFTGQVAAAAAAGGQAVTQQSFLKGVAGAIAALSQPERSAQQFAENTVGSVVPNFLKKIAQATDTDTNGQVINRDPQGFTESITGGIPGLRSGISPKLDEFGQQTTSGQGAVGTIFDPLKTSQVKNENDPLTKELRGLSDAKEPIGVSTLDKKTKVGGEDVEFTPEDIRNFSSEAGPKVKDAWNEAIKTKEYQDKNPTDRKKALENIRDDILAATKFKIAAQKGVGNLEKAANDLSSKQTDLAKGEKSDVSSYLADTDVKKTNPRKYYEQQLAKYEKDVKGGKLSSSEQFSRQQELGKLNITSSYSKEVTDLYAMSKTQLRAYFEEHPENADDLLSKVFDLDQKLVDGNFASKRKFKDDSIAESNKGGRKKGSRKPLTFSTTIRRSKAAKNAPKFSVKSKGPKIAAKSSVKVPGQAAVKGIKITA